MFKSIIFTIAIILFASAVMTNAAGITNVVQNGKQITISYSPSTMIWFTEELIYNGMETDIKPYCKALYGWSPLVCTLPTVPACDTISLYGSAGIGATNIAMTYAFNCTVVV